MIRAMRIVNLLLVMVLVIGCSGNAGGKAPKDKDKGGKAADTITPEAPSKGPSGGTPQ